MQVKWGNHSWVPKKYKGTFLEQRKWFPKITIMPLVLDQIESLHVISQAKYSKIWKFLLTKDLVDWKGEKYTTFSKAYSYYFKVSFLS